MPQSLSNLLAIDNSELSDRDAFDPILDLDTRLFIDPHLLKHCDVPEFEASYGKLQKHFLSIGKLLAASDKEGDVFWNSADHLMQWREVKGLCIGYSSSGTSGSGIGPALRRRLLSTAKLIISKGRNDPELFELVGMFEEDFGPDRISDMTANIIRDDIEIFTKRVFDDMDVDLESYLNFDEEKELPINPYTGELLYLIPKFLLRDLPVALDWSHYDTIAANNKILRDNLNALIGYTWREATHSLKKDELKTYILKYPELIDDLVRQYAAKDANPYDFSSDRSGEYIWYPVTQKITKENPLELNLPSHPMISDVETMVLKICEKFKSLVEYNGLSELLYSSDGSAKHEKAAQLLFYGVAESYCESNNVLISRESDSGRGPVDFKFGTNMENSVLVEIKKSTNTSGLKKGIEKQLPEYMKSEKSKVGIYLVIDVGFTKAAIDRLNEINGMINGAAIKILHVDGNPKASASRL
ncbi:hypothetical protein LPL18_004530 [Halomonas sp. CUBES01]|uniref:hypothetical protein n=1 Tax=Halomonas sp. CUBES01 TaxID=2897340 RepID=UPI001E560B23|nr:hypothetical protein [Halomonas sp. CUBES01]MEC4766603.1 hypothetical protein [Halomonas sp. CUBES01]